MRLEPVSLRGRRFLIQFYEVMAEFGGVIPWLDGLNEMRFATNSEWFCDELIARLGQRQGRVTPYQFIDTDTAGTFVGGLLHFSTSPERLRDPRNNEIIERLTDGGASYISCLQVREPQRGTGVGNELMRRAIKTILAKHDSVYGVVSNILGFSPGTRPWARIWKAPSTTKTACGSSVGQTSTECSDPTSSRASLRGRLFHFRTGERCVDDDFFRPGCEKVIIVS